MRSSWSRTLVLASVSALGVCTLAASAGAAARVTSAATSLVPKVGTGGPQTGDFTPSGEGAAVDEEFPGEPEDEEGDEGPEPFDGQLPGGISLSKGSGKGTAVSGTAKAKSQPEFQSEFEGLNLFQQRYARGGNQFTVEPPDQALCVGNGYVVEAVNDVINVFNESGQSVLPDNTSTNIVSGFPTDVNHAVDLNSFYGYAPAINRATGVRAQFVTDPSCLYDAATQRFFVVVLTLESLPNGAFTQQNHIDIAVSQTANPTGGWNIYRLDVTNDGTNTGGVNPGPYLGDYPHIGADANGFYVTTNAYPWCCNGFAGAQIYALSKAQLASGAANVSMQHIDTSGLVNAPSDAGPTQPGFTVWPAQSPGTGSFETANGGTEYFLSSNAADEATHPKAGTGGDHTSSQIVVWTLANTSSLNSGTPNLSLSNRLVSVNQYALPPKQRQPGSGTAPGLAVPQGHCINDIATATLAGVGCWRLLFAAEPAHTEVISHAGFERHAHAAGDVRERQAVGGARQRGERRRRESRRHRLLRGQSRVREARVAGAPGRRGRRSHVSRDRRHAEWAGRDRLHLHRRSTFPSAAYTPIDAKVGAGAWSFAGRAARELPWTTALRATSPRWGTRRGPAGATTAQPPWTATRSGSRASTSPRRATTPHGAVAFFGATTGDNKLGTCAPSPGAAGPRVALGNWSTHIAKLNP